MRPAIARSYTSRYASPSMIVAHLDLDAFFAAVEELEQPELKKRAADRRRRPARPRRRRDGELHGARLRDPLGDVVRRGAAPLPARRLRPAADVALPRLLARGLVARPRDGADRRAGRDRRGLPRPRRGRARTSTTRARSPRRCRRSFARARACRARSASRTRRSSRRSRPTGASRAGSPSSGPAARRTSSRRSRFACCPASGRAPRSASSAPASRRSASSRRSTDEQLRVRSARQGRHGAARPRARDRPAAARAVDGANLDLERGDLRARRLRPRAAARRAPPDGR